MQMRLGFDESQLLGWMKKAAPAAGLQAATLV